MEETKKSSAVVVPPLALNSPRDRAGTEGEGAKGEAKAAGQAVAAAGPGDVNGNSNGNQPGGSFFAHYFLTFGWETGRPLLTYDEGSFRTGGGGSSRGPNSARAGSVTPLQVAFKAGLLARYPEQDRPDVPFPPHTWMFCFPRGMVLKDRDPPKPLYFPVVLTAEDGTQLYGASLTFYEQLSAAEVQDLYHTFYTGEDRRSSEAPHSPTSSDSSSLATSTNKEAMIKRALPKKLYAPKSICILSRYSFTLFFRDWLCGVYSLSKELPHSMIDAFIVQLIDKVPMPQPSVGLSLTLGEKQLLMSPVDNKFPMTDIPLHFLFEVLDIDNVLLLFSAVLMEQKLLLVSSQFTLLTYVSESIRSLLYPFEWQHVFVPVLPACLTEFVGSPTPFIMGIHKSYYKPDEIAPYSTEVVVVDLDHNRIVVPESVQAQVPPLPEPEHAILVSELRKFLHNDLFYLDDYYSSSRAPAAASLLKRTHAAGSAAHRQSTYQAPISPRHHSTAYHAAPSAHIVTTSAATSSSSSSLSLSSSSAAAAGSAVTTRFDEAIRHAFLMFFVSLFRNYRDHLTYIRVFPEPMAIFNKKNFLLLRPDAAGWFEPFLETQLFTSFLNRHSWPRANVFDQSIDAALFDLELDQVLAQLARPTQTRTVVVPAPPVSFHPGSHVDPERFPLIGRPQPPPPTAAADDSAGADKDHGASGEGSSGGGDDKVMAQKKKIVRRKSRFGKLPPIPGLGGGSSHAAENGSAAAAETTSPAAAAGGETTTGGEAQPTSEENGGGGGGGDGEEGAMTELQTCVSKEERRERKWLVGCMQTLFEHSEEKGASGGGGGRALETEDMSKLFERLKDEALRLEFARAIEAEVKRSPKEGQLSGRSFAQLTELMKACLREASDKDDFYSCGLVMEAAFHFNYNNPKLQGVQDFVHSHLVNHDAWQNLRFWERSFYDKVKEEFNKLYDGDCRSSMRQWDSLEQSKREELISKEENIIFDCLATFAYKMLTLGTSVELVRRFVGKMSTAAQLSEERTTIIEQLLSNMTRATELTAELEADSRRSSLRPNDDFDEGGEEQEYIPVAGLNNPRHDESTEGRKKFENLLKAKSTQTRAFLTRLTVGRAGTRDKMTLNKSSATAPSNRRGPGKGKRGKKARANNKGSDSTDDSDDSESDYCAAEERNDYVVKTLTGHTEAVMSVKIHGNDVFSGSCDGTVKIWNAFTAKCTATLAGHTGWVNCLHLDHEKERLVSGSYDKFLKLWDLHRSCKIRSLTGHEGSICCMQGDLPTVVSGSFDGTMKLWDIRVGKNSQTFKGHSGPVVCLQFHDPKREILSGSRDATLKLWDARTLKCVKTFSGHRDWIRCLQFDPANATAYSGSCDTTVKKWNLESAQCELTMTKGRTGAINDLCFIDGLKVDNGKEKMPKKGGANSAYPSMRGLVTGSARGCVNVWNTHNGTCFQAIKAAHADEVVHCRPVGGTRTHVVTGAYDGLLRLWAADEYSGGLRCAATLDGHQHRVLCLDAHESKIVSGSYDRSVRVWELPLDLIQIGRAHV